MKKHIAIAAAVLLAGCVSMGTNYDPAAVSRLKVGMSESEVIALLGKPNSIATVADGSQRLAWVHSTGSMLGASARSVSLPFDASGHLTSVPAIEQ